MESFPPLEDTDMNAMDDKLCGSCTYSSAEGYCGNGVLSLLDTSYCSLYEGGPRAIPNRGRPHWDHPDPILPHQRQRVTGCKVVPINWDGNYGRYCLYLDRYHPYNPGDAMVVDMLMLMEGFPWVRFLLREGCRFDSAYGEQYLDREGRPATVSLYLHPRGRDMWGEYKVRAYLHVSAWVPRTLRAYYWYEGTAAHEVPEQYWWLDPTLPPSTLYPMHQLLMAVIKEVSATNDPEILRRIHAINSDSPISRERITSTLMDTLNLGLQLRDRPLQEWLILTDLLYLQHFKQAPPPGWAIPLWSVDADLNALYGGRPHG